MLLLKGLMKLHKNLSKECFEEDLKMKEVATINLEKNDCKSVYLHYPPFCIIIALQVGADPRKLYLSNKGGKRLYSVFKTWRSLYEH